MLRLLGRLFHTGVVVLLWAALGYGVAIGLRAGVSGKPLGAQALRDLPGGSLALDVANWSERAPLEIVTALDPFGYRYAPGGERTFCILGTQGCGRAEVRWPTIDLSSVLPQLADQTWTWIAVGGIAAALASLTRRRQG